MAVRTTPKVSVTAAIALLTPLTIVCMLSVYIIVGWLRGTDPFWPTPGMNVAEAAMARDHAEVMRLIREGADPNRAWPVRPELNDGVAVRLTPLEAAVQIRRLPLVALIVREGARVTPAERDRLVALAVRREAPDIVSYLDTLPVTQ